MSLVQLPSDELPPPLLSGSTKVTPQTSTSTTLLCTNAGVISTCDATVVAPTATNFIQNQTASTQTAGFKIDGTGTAGTLVSTTAVKPAV
ncbi:hypothetical protein IPL68_04475 [Candidatus Saccharibacteria bacterium]|nr:MAG: hypothetical protein IPL68_04475 [Candidatus Saccharibacteria bacterium]